MGRAIIGGVITSTLLTLVVVPVLYSYLVRERRPAAAPVGSIASAGGSLACTCRRRRTEAVAETASFVGGLL